MPYRTRVAARLVAALCLLDAACQDDAGSGGTTGVGTGETGTTPGSTTESRGTEEGTTEGTTTGEASTSETAESEVESDSGGAAMPCAELTDCYDACDPDESLCLSECHGSASEQARADAAEFTACWWTVCSGACMGDRGTCNACLMAQCPTAAYSCRGIGAAGESNLPDPISLACTAAEPLPDGCIDAAAGNTVWAEAATARSSEFDAVYWAADRVAGAPDVYPCYGDIAGAWSSAAPDEGDESITVDLGAPTDAVAVLVVETFSRAAVSTISVSTDGTMFSDVATLEATPERGGSCIRRVALDEPASGIRYLRLTLDSAAVPGWSQIDAIGVEPR